MWKCQGTCYGVIIITLSLSGAAYISDRLIPSSRICGDFNVNNVRQDTYYQGISYTVKAVIIKNE